MTDQKKSWQAVDILVSPVAVEAVESALNELESLGTEADSLRKAKGEPQIVTGFFEVSPKLSDIKSCVEDSLRIYGFTSDALKSITTRTVEETDWLAEWKKYWKPTPVGKFVIAPPWETVDELGLILIRIEPNMAFGTGTHETTQLCLDAIGSHYDPQQSFLDVGTGTGILSIAAAKMGGSGIVACDTDADSIKIARENAVANDVGDRIEFFDGSIGDETADVDFVCANLTLDVIQPILPLLIAKAKTTLLLSGILGEQESQIVSDLTGNHQTHFEIQRAGEWISVIVKISSAS
ncbi:hypothetical protein BH10ACI2_BH10ACI2_15740 [soil metagenome]